MKILIGFDILLSYLLRVDSTDGIYMLFRWIDRIGAEKYTDSGSITILTHFVSTKELLRLQGFHLIKDIPQMPSVVKMLKELIETRSSYLHGDERALIMQLNILYSAKVDFLITENSKAHDLARMLNLDVQVYTMEDFIERCSADYRDLDETKGIEIHTVKLGSLSIKDVFFRTFIDEYQPYYYKWFEKKANDDVYVAFDKVGGIRALLKLKLEGTDENYSDITPTFVSARRLKICSFKVEYTGQKLGQRFMRIIFDHAAMQHVDEIYITIVKNSPQRRRLINMLERWGFVLYGMKQEHEQVYVRSMNRNLRGIPEADYPYQSITTPTYLVPIGRSYAQALLPTIEMTRCPSDMEPYKSAIRKVLVLHTKLAKLNVNANLLFYQLSHNSNVRGIIASGIVDGVYQNFVNKEAFLLRCRKRSILTTGILNDCWQRGEELTVINFLYNYSFGRHSITDKTLIRAGIDIAPLFEQKPIAISVQQFTNIIHNTDYEQNIIVY